MRANCIQKENECKESNRLASGQVRGDGPGRGLVCRGLTSRDARVSGSTVRQKASSP